MKKQIAILTGAGMSAESGISTFRDSNGLWENHDIYEVASPAGWNQNPELVLEFYNQRRKQALSAKPNKAHKLLANLEQEHEVSIITQNVDHLHEEAGSMHVLHLHGKLFESRSTKDESLIYTMKNWQLNWGDRCELGSQLRPNIVWFGEPVPAMEQAIEITKRADIFLVVGTSLQVYPAAGLLEYSSNNCPIYLIDPNEPEYKSLREIYLIKEKATSGMSKFIDMINS